MQLPPKIKLDVPRLLLKDFEQAFFVRTIEQTTGKPDLTPEQILVWMDEHMHRTGAWPKVIPEIVHGTEETWQNINAALHAGVRGLAGLWRWPLDVRAPWRHAPDSESVDAAEQKTREWMEEGRPWFIDPAEMDAATEARDREYLRRLKELYPRCCG